jgi:GNAT superfamily N-acetyltransferase
MPHPRNRFLERKIGCDLVSPLVAEPRSRPYKRESRERDLTEADRLLRLAFGTYLGLPDPSVFLGDADVVRPRWRADPSRAFCTEVDGELLGSNFATRWGTFGFFGPLSVRPDAWAVGLGKRLMEPVMSLFADWEVRLAGLFTFPHSPKHVGLYERHGFHPRYLTAVLARSLASTDSRPDAFVLDDWR